MPYVDIEYIDPSALAESIKEANDSLPAPIVVDVRDDDFMGGHIKGAMNITVDSFEDDDDVDELVKRFQGQRRVVFHCMMSQVRGPFCAKRFASRAAAYSEEDPNYVPPQVQILRGGYEKFFRQFRQEKELFEDLFTEKVGL